MFMKNFFKNIDFRQIIPCAEDCFLVKSDTIIPTKVAVAFYN